MRVLSFVALAILIAGCASEPHAGHAAERWTFTQRTTAEDVVDIGSAEGFALEITLNASSNARQIGGQWHGPLAAGEPVTLRFDASEKMIVEWRVKSGAAGASGRCEWGPEGATKDVALGSARMTNTTTTCEIVFTPTGALADPAEPTLRWEARSKEAHLSGWSLLFAPSRG